MSDWDGQVDVFDLFKRLSLDEGHPASGGAEVNSSCPFHEDNRPSFYMNATSTAWWCFSCKKHGRDCVSFVEQVMGVSTAEAQQFVSDNYGVAFREPAGSMRAEVEARFAEREPSHLILPAPSWQETFENDFWSSAGIHAREYMLSRGFLPETLREWSFGWDALSDRVTVPVHDVEGVLVGFKSRRLYDGPGCHPSRYMPLGDVDRTKPRYGFDTLETSHHVFGLNRSRHVRTVVACEGEFDPVALSGYGVERPVGLGGSAMSDFHADLIAQECDEVIIFFDTDDAGRPGAWAGVRKLEHRVRVKVVPDHEGDPASMLPSQALDLIAQARSSLSLRLDIKSLS